MQPGLNNREDFKPLGGKAVDSLGDWLRQYRYGMRLDRWLDGGGSGGKVAVVYLEECDGRRNSRRLVLKLCPSGEDTEYEPGNNRMAWADVPQRFSRHLLEPVDVIQVADTSWWLMFQRLAKGGTRGIDTLARVPESRLPATYTAIARPLLSDWGEWTHVPSMLVSDFLTRQLGKRLGPKGGVRAWASFCPELLEEPVPWIEIANDKLPNPFALVKGSSFGDTELQNVYVGRAHGDLHPGNILMPVAPNVLASQFVLVDLARYRTEAPLAQDPAQLLLCLIAQHYLLSSPAQREALISLLARPGVSVGTLVPPTASALVRNFWQLSRPLFERGLADQWNEQGCLSVLACALMFLGRPGINPAERWWFFRLAAYAAQAYVDLAEETQADGPVCHVDPPDDEQQREANDTPEPPSTPEERDSPRDDARAGGTGLRVVDPQVSGSADDQTVDPGNRANVRRVDFGQRRRAKKAARLIVLVGADVARLADEVTAIPRTLPPDVAYSRATSARQLAAALASAIGELASLGGEEEFALGAAIQYTQALGQAETALLRAQELMSCLDTSANAGDDLGALSTAVGQVSSAVAELDSLVGPYP